MATKKVTAEVTEADLAFFEANKPRKGRVAAPNPFVETYSTAKEAGVLGKVLGTPEELGAAKKGLLKAAAAAGDGRPVFVQGEDALFFLPRAKQKRTKRS